MSRETGSDTRWCRNAGHKGLAGDWPDAVLRIYLRPLGSPSYSLEARVKLMQFGVRSSRPDGGVMFWNQYVVGSAKPRMWMIVEVMIIAHSIHIGPRLHGEIETVIDA